MIKVGSSLLEEAKQKFQEMLTIRTAAIGDHLWETVNGTFFFAYTL